MQKVLHITPDNNPSSKRNYRGLRNHDAKKPNARAAPIATVTVLNAREKTSTHMTEIPKVTDPTVTNTEETGRDHLCTDAGVGLHHLRHDDRAETDRRQETDTGTVAQGRQKTVGEDLNSTLQRKC